MKKTIFKFIKGKRVRARLVAWAKLMAPLALITLAIWTFAPTRPIEPAVAVDQISFPDNGSVKDQVIYAQADERALRLAAYLKEKNSVLADYAVNFVEQADKYGLDWRLLPAIAGDESGFARRYVAGTYNAWGWGGGYIRLGSWAGAVETLSQALREKYINRLGTDDVYRIGKMWAADPDWARKVSMYMREIGNSR